MAGSGIAHSDPAVLSAWVPLKLTTHLPDPGSCTGAPALHPQFERYLCGERAPRDTGARAQRWWTPEWVERELFAFFPAEAVTIVLSVLRDGQTWQDALALSDWTFPTIKPLMHQMADHCRKVLTTA